MRKTGKLPEVYGVLGTVPGDVQEAKEDNDAEHVHTGCDPQSHSRKTVNYG